jgi:PAS domain S-box-containing protein
MAKHQCMSQPSGPDDRSLSDMQLLLETTGVGMWAYDGGSNVFRLDQTCRQMFELADGEVMSLEVARQRIHPEDIGPYWQSVREALQGGKFAINYRIVRKDGSLRFISSRGRTLPASPGAAAQIKGICIDVTDKQRLEDRLRSAEARLQHLADGVPGLFSYIDHDYRIQFLSSAYRSIFDTQPDAMVGRHMAELIGPHAFADRQPRYDRALAGEVVQHEGARLMPDGQERYFTVTHQPHRDVDGRVLGVMSLAIDITERRAAEEALQQKSEELVRSNRELEQFAYVASHDLKAPLRAIEVLAQWLHEDLKDYTGGEVQENLGLLSQRTQRLNRLLDDLLAYSRAGRQIGECQEVDTDLMVQDIASLLSPPAGMRVVTEGTMPVLTAHSAPLEQVLRNLINNAIKHHPTQQGMVRVSARDQGDTVMFAVADDGAGIPEEYAEKVFQMFQTLQPRDDREGSGMGLAIVKRIVDSQGGRVWFHPGPEGRGTVFRFTWHKLDEFARPASREAPIPDSNAWRTDETRQFFVG